MTATLTPKELFERNQGLVGHVLKHVPRDPKEVLLADDDLMQVGLVALWKASEKFDPTRTKSSFGAVAAQWIRNAMVEERRRYQWEKRDCSKVVREWELPLPSNSNRRSSSLDRILVDHRGLRNEYHERLAATEDAVLATVPARWREMARRRYVDRASWPAIAQEFGYAKPNTVKIMVCAHWRRAVGLVRDHHMQRTAKGGVSWKQ